jgi:ribonuclease P protein component
VKRRFRLRKFAEFQRVRRYGKSFAHPLIVLVVMPNPLEFTRFGIIAGRSLGKAVRRNRVKRVIRAALVSLKADVPAGWDVIVIARKPMGQATYLQVRSTLVALFKRAHLLVDEK